MRLVKVRYTESPSEKSYSYIWRDELGEPTENMKIKVPVRSTEKSAWICSSGIVDEDYLNKIPYQLKEVIDICQTDDTQLGAST